MKKLFALLLLLSFIAAADVVAPGATYTQNSSTDNTAATICATASGATATATLTPQNGQSVYVTSIEVISTATTAPVISALTHTTTGLGGYKMFDLFPAATGVVKTTYYPAHSLKTSQGTAAVVTSQGAITNITYNATICGYFAP